MRVLYVSKSMVVPAYRDKLGQLSRWVELSSIMPQRWGRVPVPPPNGSAGSVRQIGAWLHGYNHFHLYRRLEPTVAELRPDLVHIDEEPYSAVTAQTLAICRRLKVPALFFAAQTLNKPLPPPFRQLRRYVFDNVAGAIAGTEAAGDVLIRAGYQHAVRIIPQIGVNPDLYKPDPGAREQLCTRLGIRLDRLLIGFGGRLVHQKGVHLLIEAVGRLPQAELVVIGDGVERTALCAQAKRLGISPRIHFVGQIDSPEVPHWLAALDVLVLPSITTTRIAEQFGRILVEAMACGVPVVGSTSGEIPKVIGEGGVTFPEQDVNALSAVLTVLAADQQARERLGRLGRERVLANFTNERIARETVDFYDALLRSAS